MPRTTWAAKDHALEEQNEQKSSQSKYKNAFELEHLAKERSWAMIPLQHNAIIAEKNDLAFLHHHLASKSDLTSYFYETTFPLQLEQSTCSALPTANPTPVLPNSAALAPLSIHKSKFKLAPYWFVPVNPFCAHRGLLSAGQRLVTCTTIGAPKDRLLPEESVDAVNFQQVPHAGPAPAPVPTPNSFWDTAAE